jgi:Flp pilus assembly protein TadG
MTAPFPKPGRRRQRGTALIEFAFVLPFLIVLTLAVVDVSRAFWVKNVVTQAAREGARWLAAHPTADLASVQNRAAEVLTGSNLTIKTCSVTAVGATHKKVTVSSDFNWLFLGLFSWVGNTFSNPVTLSGACTMYMEL